MPRRLLGLPLITVALCGALVAQEPGDRSLSPETLYWRNRDGTPNRATGLLYRPELLSVLIASRARDTVPERILRAVGEQTPIVVMWTIPPTLDEQAVGPSSARILDTTSGENVAPIWETHDAADLRMIDPQIPLERVGVVAAFPRSAFQPGRVVVIYAPLPDNPATGAHRRSQVFGEFQETRLRPK
jgi:hypothetical protein